MEMIDKNINKAYASLLEKANVLKPKGFHEQAMQIVTGDCIQKVDDHGAHRGNPWRKMDEFQWKEQEVRFNGNSFKSLQESPKI